MFADLHIHTRLSDGSFSPEEVVAEARRQGLAAIALTDHDTVEGCAAAATACAAAGMEFLVGVELTAEQAEREVHILGYGLDPACPELAQALGRFQTSRQQRIREIVARLNQLDIALEAEAVFAFANCSAPGRPHVARTLVAAGVCSSLDEAFERFLKKHRPAWVPKFKMSAAESFKLIHDAGGIAVLAHPILNKVDDHLPGMVAAGLDGIECYHTKHTPAITDRYIGLANRLGVLITGGSDCHGLNKGKPLIGTVRLPYEHFEKIKARLAARRRPNRWVEPDKSAVANLQS